MLRTLAEFEFRPVLRAALRTMGRRMNRVDRIAPAAGVMRPDFPPAQAQTHVRR